MKTAIMSCIAAATLPTLMVFLVHAVSSTDITTQPGHLKPFGDGRPTTSVDEINNFPNPKHFFENYVKKSRPLKMIGAARFSKALKKWTDDYFLTQDEAAEAKISVETRKKENRQQNVEELSFQDFVKIYNTTEHYMVDAVPAFIKKDIMIPCPLQCPVLVEKNLVDNVMWFSSGGTKSVVHTDSVDNINCLFRGEKTLVFVDPEKHGHNVDLDRPDGAYSSMDVDHVDFSKYPGMAEVDYYHVNISAGDCLYIPYLWIHQVRSYGSNLAVNIWWSHFAKEDIDYNTCTDPCDPDFTLEEATFLGFNELERQPEGMRDHFLMMLGNKPGMDSEAFIRGMLGEMYDLVMDNKDASGDMYEMFGMLDTDKDGIISKQDIKDSSDEALENLGDLMQVIDEDILSGPYEDQEHIDIDLEHQSTAQPPHNDDSDEIDLHDEL